MAHAGQEIANPVTGERIRFVRTAADTGGEVQRIAFGADCTYRVSLPPGSYRAELDRRGIDTSRDLPRTVTVQAGQTTRLDVSIDTGIR